LERALKMEQLAQRAGNDKDRQGYFKAAEAYHALAKDAEPQAAPEPKRD
jgi:hypothetical protein